MMFDKVFSSFIYWKGRCALPFAAHFGGSFFDGLLGHAVCDEPAAEFFDSVVLGALGFELGQVLAQTVPDVGANERLI